MGKGEADDISMYKKLVNCTTVAELSLQDYEGGPRLSAPVVKNEEVRYFPGRSKIMVLGNLTKADPAKIIALITTDVHSRDCNQGLVQQKKIVREGGG